MLPVRSIAEEHQRLEEKYDNAIEELIKKEDELETANEMIGELTERISNLRDEVALCDVLINDLTDRLTAKNKSIRMLQEKIKPKDYEIEVLTKENETLKNINTQYKKRLVSLESQLSLYINGSQ